jgi:hypothetical protein
MGPLNEARTNDPGAAESRVTEERLLQIMIGLGVMLLAFVLVFMTATGRFG